MKIISSYEYGEIKRKLKDAEAEAEHIVVLETRFKTLTERLDDRTKSLNEAEKKYSDIANAAIEKIKTEYEIMEKKAVAALEDRLAKAQNAHDKKHNDAITRLEKEMTKKKNDELETMMKDHYKKLSDAMSKLHEDGNAQTKFMQEITNNVIKSASGFAKPSTQIEHKS